MRSGHVEHGDAELYYESTGEGPAVLFLHAGVTDSRMWQNQMGLEGFQTIAFDQRGFGRSEWVDGPFANRHDALAVLDHLQRDSAIVVGCSNGGEAALQLAIVAPHRVNGLVLVCSAPRGWEPEGGWQDDPLWDEAQTAIEERDFDRAVEIDAQMWLAGRGRSLDEVDPDLLELFRDMDRAPVKTEARRNDHVETLEPPTNHRLGEIVAPTLVVVGERDDPDLITAAGYLANQLSHRDAVILKDTAHLPPLERPEAFNTELMAFLRGLVS
jgi:pimeloyl-ACP methyl ester carboxylesterase